jgi:hypothetical protein
MSGKGDTTRPYDGDKFRRNYETIFRKGKPVLIDEYHPNNVKLRDHSKHSKKKTK